MNTENAGKRGRTESKVTDANGPEVLKKHKLSNIKVDAKSTQPRFLGIMTWSPPTLMRKWQELVGNPS